MLGRLVFVGGLRNTIFLAFGIAAFVAMSFLFGLVRFWRKKNKKVFGKATKNGFENVLYIVRGKLAIFSFLTIFLSCVIHAFRVRVEILLYADLHVRRFDAYSRNGFSDFSL